MRLRLAFDVDGVLADFHSGFQTAAQQILARKIAKATDPEHVAAAPLGARELKRVWKSILRTPNWWIKLPAYEPAQIARLYTLSRDRKWEVFFVTKRPPTAGDPVQFQTQWWLEAQGFYLPSVVTVPGSRGELANALHLDLVVDDQLLNCVEVISASRSAALLLVRDPDPQKASAQAASHGIAVVRTLEQALEVAERLQEKPAGRGRWLHRLAGWLSRPSPSAEAPPLDPRQPRPPLQR